jgi:deazaflavin-dependent oxidoreductase (nitroreductase family)
MSQPLAQFEISLFDTVNLFAEPLIRAGLGNPVWWPTGAIVIETKGRHSGRRYKVPLLAARIGGLLLVSTVRRRSQWLKNLAANPEMRYWIAGEPHEATAVVIAPSVDTRLDRLPPMARCMASALAFESNLLGVSFAILVSHNGG